MTIASAWTFGWEALVAIGTLLLALATAGLAVAAFVTAKRTETLAEKTEGIASETERMANETRALADLQRKAAQAAVKPTLMPGARFSVTVSLNPLYLSLSVQNVGSGLAILELTRMRRMRGADRPDERGGVLSEAVVPPGHTIAALFSFEGQKDRFDDFTQGAFWIEVVYTDAEQEQRETAIFHIEEHDAADNLNVVRVQLQREGESEPYVSSGYGAIR